MKTRHFLIGTLSAAALVLSTLAIAQTMPDYAAPGHRGMRSMLQEPGGPMMDMAAHDRIDTGGMPTMPGQAAFGAVKEIVQILEADPDTDWSKVNLGVLRKHLIDMDEVTMKAVATEKPVDGGLEISVTGTGRTLDAIQRMVPVHAYEIDQTHLNGWSAKTQRLANGVLLTVTGGDPKEVAHIRGLGFIGIMVSGSHHQPHHLAMAKGEFAHNH